MTAPTPEDLVDVLNRRKAQQHEYGQWVAAEPIDVGTARAFNAGDPVPASTVARFGWDEQGLAVKAGSAAAEEIVDQVAGTVERPPGNASRDEWAAYAAAQGTPLDELDGLSRDEIRDRFATEG